MLLILSNFVVVLTSMGPRHTATAPSFPTEQQESEITHNLATMKGWFTENQGQIENSEVRYVYAGSGCSFGFVESGYLVKLTGEDNSSSVIQVTFGGSNTVAPEGREELSHKSNYFIGNNATQWRTGLHNYGRVVYEGLYDGIDLVFYTTEKGLKYDFVVQPFNNPQEIRIKYDGAESSEIDVDGNLVIETGVGALREEKPYSYQKINDEIVEITSEYKIENGSVLIEIERYDSSKPLVIDPLIYSTFVGGAGGDEGYALTLDSQENAYVTGFTSSSDFPTTSGCYDNSYNGDPYDVFVLKLSSNGSGLLYSTLIGGSGGERGNGIALDSERNVFVTGETYSDDFPTTAGCHDDSYNNDDRFSDIFVFKLKSDGSDLVYSTYVGGDRSDRAKGIVLDAESNAYVVGHTEFSGNHDVFVFKLKPDGSRLTYSTHIGGDGTDHGKGIVLDSGKNAYVTGGTSGDFPTTSGCYDDTHNGNTDVFVLKLNSDGDEILFSTYIGGDKREGDDFGSGLLGIALDSENNTYVTGNTVSADFPTTSGCYDDRYNGGDHGDVFVFKLDSKGSNLLYSTFIGGSKDEGDWGSSIAVGSEGNIYVTAQTGSSSGSSDFPTTPGCYDDSINGDSDVVALKLNPAGNGKSDLVYSTFVGGSEDELGTSIFLDTKKNICITGVTASPNFPTTPGCYDDSRNQKLDIFIFKLNILTAYIDTVSPDPAYEGEEIQFSCHAKDNTEVVKYVWSSNIDGEIYNGTKTEFVSSSLNVGEHTIFLKAQDDEGYWSDEVNTTVLIHEKPVAHIDSVSPSPALDTDNIHFEGHGTDDGTIERYAWRSNVDDEFYNNTNADCYCGDLSNGTHTIYLKVKDNYDVWSDEVSTTLIINGKPRAYIDSMPSTPVLDTDTIYFEGHGTDDESVTQYAWRSDIDGEFYNDTKDYFNVTDFSVGVHSIFFKVLDNDGAWSDEVSRSLIVHEKPVGIIDSISPNPALDTDTISFKSNGTDDGTIERYVWHSSIDGEFYNGTNTYYDYTELSNGTHTIHHTVKDNYDVWSDEVSTTLTINGKPRAYIDSISPNPARKDKRVSFAGHGSDDGSVAEYTWRSDKDGNLSTKDGFDTSILSSGTHIIYFKVKDNDDAWSDEVSEMLIINEKPVAQIDSILPNPATDTDILYFSGRGNDDGSIALYMWRSNIDGEFYNGTLSSINYGPLSGGVHTIYFRVKDNHGVWSDEVSGNLTITMKPVATIDEINPNSADEGVEIWFYGNGTDEDGVIEDYFWSSNRDGILSNEQSFNRSNLSIGIHTIYFKVKDNSSYWSDQVSTELEILNAIPEAVIDSVAPPNPLETENVTFEGHGIDYGTIGAYLWESNIDGVIGTVDFFSRTLSPGLHAISFTVKDNAGAWSHPDARKIWVNDIPETSIKPGYPGIVNESENLTLEGSGEDLGAIQGYEWKSNIDGIIGNEAILKVSNLSVGIHNITFRVMDNETIWSENISAIIRVNGFPVAMAGNDIHSFPHVEVQFNGEGTDSGGEIVKYEWDFNGNGIYDWSSDENGLARFIYNNPGEYTAILRVTDNDGAQSTDALVVTVDMNITNETGGDAGFLPGFEAVSISVSVIVVAVWWRKRRECRDEHH